MKYLFLILLLSGCSSTPKTLRDYFNVNILGTPLHHAKLPVQLKLDKSVPRELVPLFTEAVQTINEEFKIPVLSIDLIPINADFNRQHRDHQNVIFWGEPNNFLEKNFPYEQAKTTCFGGGNTLDECDIRFNPTSHNNFKHLDLDTLIRHELYHVLGFIHQPHDRHIMSSHLKDHTKKQGLDAESIKMFYQVYKIPQNFPLTHLSP